MAMQIQDQKLARRQQRRNTWIAIGQNKYMYLMYLPAFILLIIFAYYPMYGVLLAFKDFDFSKGILFSPFAKNHGMYNFIRVFRNPSFFNALKNTLIISASRLIYEFPIPIVMALLLNEVRSSKYKRVVQTVYTFPHFISWVIVTGLFFSLFANEGIINQLLVLLGQPKTMILSNPKTFRAFLYATSNWKEAGWSAIIYLASITGISPELYEAGRIDGATRRQLCWYITLPSIKMTIIILFVMQVASLMNAGFDQIFNLYNAAVQDVTDIIDTLVYRTQFKQGSDFGYTTAIGLFKSLVNFALLLFANGLVYKINGRGIY
ncbi:MAG: ABC transporter permease subunit [Clostridiaceae bacterium]|nr:ABC transporter permease subunit [Clostridiaceae bacterium]